MMTTATADARRILHVSVREGRLVTDRILLTLGLPSGCIPAIREGILLSHAMGLGGLGHLHRVHKRLAQARFDAMTIKDAGTSALEIDGGGIHAWLIVPTVTDLAVDLARRTGKSEARLTGVSVAEELMVMEALATRHGAVARVTLSQSASGVQAGVSVRNAPRPRALADWDPLLIAAMRNHYSVEETLWRMLFELSNQALAPDSVLSRRHAGPVILMEDGTIIGRLPADDDFDPRMLQTLDPTKLEQGSANDKHPD